MKSLNGVAVVAAWGALGVGVTAVAQTTWTVCQDGSCDFTDIQSAIDASSSGDMILISSGTFTPSATLGNAGKSIHLRGGTDASGQPVTILDGADSRQLLSLTGPSAVVENIVFQRGRANAGGALTIGSGCAPSIINCIFSNNNAIQFGGGVHAFQATPTFEQCTFEGNTALINGGGLYPVNSNSTFVSCTVSGNTAPNGAGMFLAGNCTCHTSLIDTVVCSNTNTSSSPSQVFAAGNSTWTADATTCISADCTPCYPDCDNNGIPDTCECIADLTGNGEVNGADISVLLGFWGKVPEPLPSADINRDGLVDGLDLAVLLGSWGPCQ